MELLIIAALLAAIIYLGIQKKKKPKFTMEPDSETEPKKDEKTWTANAYTLKESIFTKSEQKLYAQLESYIPKEYIICPKVGLKDFVGTKEKNDMKHFGKIAQKHIDFLICKKETMHPCLGIELDDYTHQNAKQQERDAFINSIYNEIGLKIIHVYNIKETEKTKQAILNILQEECADKQQNDMAANK